MRAAVLAAVLVVLAFYTFFRGVPERSTVDQLEVRLRDYPVAAGADTVRPIGEYSRYYASVNPKSIDDLPFFTTVAEDPRFLGRPLIAGVLVRPGMWETGPIGIHRVSPKQLPEHVHGGCHVVNVLYDPKADEIVGAWCNVMGGPEDGLPPGATPSPPAR